MFKQTYPRSLQAVSAIMQDVEAALRRMKLPQKRLTRTLLLTEECVAALVENLTQKKERPIEVCVRKHLGDISIRITAEGEEYDPTLEVHTGTESDDQDRDVQAALRSRILQAYGNELSHTYKNKRNILFITAKKSGQKSLYLTLGAFSLAFYLFTSMCAIAIGIGMFFLLQPGAPVMELPMAAAQETAQMESVSILNIIVNIVPDNIVTAFQNADMLQVIFIAVLCGIAVGAIGEQGKVLRDIFNACNELFLRITRMIISLVPIATFCAITSLVATTGLEMLKMLASLVGTILLGLIVLILVYGLLIFLFTRERPFTFYRKYSPCMLLAFTLSSSNAVMPSTIEYCENKLGVPPKIASFSIPLGSTINMDGSCVYLANERSQESDFGI